jgi:hypothetical protein
VKVPAPRAHPTPWELFAVFSKSEQHVAKMFEKRASKGRVRTADVAAVEGVPPRLDAKPTAGVVDSRVLDQYCKGCGVQGHDLYAIKEGEILPNCPRFARRRSASPSRRLAAAGMLARRAARRAGHQGAPARAGPHADCRGGRLPAQGRPAGKSSSRCHRCHQ